MYVNSAHTENVFRVTLGSIMPWSSKLGAPGFPENYLWTSESGLTIDKTVVEFDAKRLLFTESILSDLKKIRVDLDVISNTEGRVEFKYDGQNEASIHEVIDRSNKRITLTFSSPKDPNADLIMTITLIEATSELNILFDFNGSPFVSTVGIDSKEIPQCVLDLLDAIDSYKPNIILKSLQPETLMPYGLTFIGNGGQSPQSSMRWQDTLNCWSATALAALLNPALGIAVGIANAAIIMA